MPIKEPELALPCLQTLFNGAYSEPIKSIPYPLTPFLEDPFKIFSSIPGSTRGFQTKIVCTFHVCYQPWESLPPWQLRITKLLVACSVPTFAINCKYSPEHLSQAPDIVVYVSVVWIGRQKRRSRYWRFPQRCSLDLHACDERQLTVLLFN
jgi:hypothetical protein